MPRNAPDRVQEHRLTLGTYERQQIEPLIQEVTSAAKGAKVATWTAAIGAVALPMALVTAGGAIALGLVGFGLDNVLDRERIRDVLLGTPSVTRTRRDGTEQTIDNLFFGVPIIGPLFGTGMRIGERTVEAATGTINTVDDAVKAAVGTVTTDYQDAILRRQATEARADQAGRTSAGGGTIGTRTAPRDPGAADPRNRWSSGSAGGWSV